LSDLLTIASIALGLAMDAFSVAIGVGCVLPQLTKRRIFRLSWHFGLFQALMPALGWLVGVGVERYISAFDNWVAFGLLAFVGVRMVRSGLDADDDGPCVDPSRGGTLVMLAIATSIDAFAVGLSFAVLRVSIVWPVIIIGLVAALMSILGIYLGNRLGHTFGKRMEVIGGLILVAIGIRVVISHML